MSSSTSPVDADIRFGRALEIMCSECGEEMEEFMLLARDEFISAMLRIHAANYSRK